MHERSTSVRRYRTQRRPSRRLLLLGGVAVASAAVAAAVVLATRGAQRTLPATLSLVGDSLNVGIEPYIGRELRGWRIATDDVPGRATDAGLAELRAAGSSLGSHVLVSLGTNDVSTPTAAFRSDVREALRIAGADRCVVWFTIFRYGRPDARLNAVLADEERRNDNLRLVDWAELAGSHPSWIGPDGIHATDEGYAGRARAAARALRAC